MQSTAASLNIRFTFFHMQAPSDLDAVFARLAAARRDAVVVQGDTLFSVNRKRVASLSLKHRLPSSASITGYAEAGGLLEYGPDRLQGYRRAAYFVDRILKGAKPAELPMEQPTHFETVINTTSAKALGLTIPQTLAGARLI